MTMNISYNLADIALYYPYGPDYEQHLTDTCCDRFYIGSYFCSKYCMKSIHLFLWNALPFFEQNGLHIALVIPSPTEHENAALKQSVAACLAHGRGCIDELVVNDYGMLKYVLTLRDQYPVKVTAGRLFTKNFRDPRYENYSQETSCVFFPRMLAGKISAIEIDAVSEQMDLSEIPADIRIHAHYPYTYVTCGQNCEFAAASQSVEHRFKGAMRCALSCMHGYMETRAAGAGLLLLGKGVYTKNRQLSYTDRKPDRYIYWPVNEFVTDQRPAAIPAGDDACILQPEYNDENTHTI